MDVSAFDGISFWARGLVGLDGAIQLQIALPATHAAEFGGDCTARCNDHPSQKVILGTEWRHFTVAFSDMNQAGFGAPATYGGIIMAMNWVSLSAANVDFWVDEVSFYSKVAPTGPVGTLPRN